MSHSITFIPRSGRLARRGVLEWHRMTADALKDCNKKHLAQMAKEQGISGWHAMRKDQLIRALTVTRSSPSRVKKATKQQPQLRKVASSKKQSANAAELAVAARRSGASAPSANAIAMPHTLDHGCQ